MNKQKSKEIIDILRDLIPNPVCELEYHNTYELICMVMLSAQTTDKRVNEVSKELFSKYPNPEMMMNASLSDISLIIKSLGLVSAKAKNLIELSRILYTQYDSIVPSTIEELVKLPGVGRKTASVVLAVGFSIPAMPVDTHLHRMAKRLGYIKDDEDVVQAEKSYKRYIPMEDWIEAHHLILLFGRYYCKASSPRCDLCKLDKYCKYRGKY